MKVIIPMKKTRHGAIEWRKTETATPALPSPLADKVARPVNPDDLSWDDICRLAIVPLVVTKVIFDQAETMRDIAARLRIRELKQPCRELRRLCDLYHQTARLSRGLDSKTDRRTEEMCEVFQERTGNMELRLCWCIDNELNSVAPDLGRDYRDLVKATHIAMVSAKALDAYNEKSRADIGRRLGRRLVDVTPGCYRAFRDMLPLFAGDKLLTSPRWRDTESAFVRQMVADMDRVEIHATDD